MVRRFQRKKRERFAAPPRMVQVLPNVVTIMALCTGLSAIRFAFMQKWDFAVAAVLIAGILDAMDGRLARFLDSATDFGAELDSLSDFISFGVAPAVIVYFFALQQWADVGWGISVFFSTCMALRLARFNVHRLSPPAPGGTCFFTGVPAPAGAFLAFLPVMLTFALEDSPFPAWVFAFFMGGSALLMVSRLPTFSFKNMRLPPRALAPILACVAVFVALFFSAPWGTLLGLGFCYLFSIPCSVFLEKRKRKEAVNAATKD
jgi:CDP-diacylglycerol--serine O-phosphatidyltransferase